MISVGAQYSTGASLELQDPGSHFFEVRTSHNGLVFTAEGLWGSFGPMSPLNGEVVKGEPFDGCAPLTNAALARGKIVLLQRGICVFVDKALAAQNAGAIAMIMQDTPGGKTVVMGGTDARVTIPCLSVASGVGGQILGCIAAGGKAEAVWQSDGPDFWQEHLASFSAKGPTGDGRTKPEV